MLNVIEIRKRADNSFLGYANTFKDCIHPAIVNNITDATLFHEAEILSCIPDDTDEIHYEAKKPTEELVDRGFVLRTTEAPFLYLSELLYDYGEEKIEEVSFTADKSKASCISDYEEALEIWDILLENMKEVKVEALLRGV